MNPFIKQLLEFADKLNSDEISVEKKYRTLKAIRELAVTLEYLKISKLGRAVKKCSKLGGKPGKLADKIVRQWTEMIHENERKSKDNVVKPSKSQKLPEKKQIQPSSSENSSESESEYANRNKSSGNYKNKSRDNRVSDGHTSNDSLSKNEKYMNNKRNIENQCSDSDEHTINETQNKSHLYNKTLESSKVNTNKSNKNDADNCDNSSGDIDSDECDKFSENFKPSYKQNNDRVKTKSSYDNNDDDSEDYDQHAEKLKLSNSGKHHPQAHSESDDSDFDSDEAYFQSLEDNRKKLSKTDNVDFLVPINENKNPKKHVTKPVFPMKSEKHIYQNDIKKQQKSDQINNTNMNYADKPPESKMLSNNVKSHSNLEHHKQKSRKSEMKHVTSFEAFLKDSALSKSIENHGVKRKSDFSTNIESKKPKVQLKKSPTLFVPTDLSDLPALNSSLSNSDMDEQSVFNRTDLIPQKKEHNINFEMKEDIDCTSKYSSERKIWTPKSRFDLIKNDVVEENIKTINGVLETEIAQYNYEKLMAFDCDSRKIQRKTEFFWEKLFKKNHKSANKREGETWRDAYIRNQKAQDSKLKELSERLNKFTKESQNAIPKAKLLTNSNLAKPKRRMTDMRR